MGYDYAHWLAVDPRGEDPREIVAAVDADEDTALAFPWPELGEAGERRPKDRQLYGDAPLIFRGGEDIPGGFEEELRDLSRRFPGALFTITTQTDEFGDFPYRRYFRGGFMQTEGCGFAPFDPNKLDRDEGDHEEAG